MENDKEGRFWDTVYMRVKVTEIFQWLFRKMLAKRKRILHWTVKMNIIWTTW